MLLFVLLSSLPDGTEAEVDLRLYKNAVNETELMTGNKLAAGYFFSNIHVAKHVLITSCMLEILVDQGKLAQFYLSKYHVVPNFLQVANYKCIATWFN